MKQKRLLTDRILQCDLADPDAAHGFLAIDQRGREFARQAGRRAGACGRRRHATNAAQHTNGFTRKTDRLHGVVSTGGRKPGE